MISEKEKSLLQLLDQTEHENRCLRNKIQQLEHKLEVCEDELSVTHKLNRSLEEYSNKLEKANEMLCQELDRVGACSGKYIECNWSCIDCWKEVSLSNGRN